MDDLTPKPRKTKRINIRISPEDHDWLFSFAKKRKTKVSKLFQQFLAFLRDSSLKDEDAED
jgi:hypothetical protein